MTVSVTYNGTSPGTPAGKIRYSEAYDRAVFSGDFYMDPNDYAAKVDSLNEWDGILAITSGNWSRSFDVTSNAVALRSTLEKLGSPIDSGSLIKVRLTVIVERIADNAGDFGWREWSANLAEDEQGAKTLTITALVTATAGATALENFDTRIASIQTGFLALHGLVLADMEEPATVFRDNDRFNNIVRVERRLVQLFEIANVADAGGSETKETTAIFTDWEVRLVTQEEQGHEDGPTKLYTCRWASLVALGTNITREDIEGRFAALVIKRLKTVFGEGTDLVLMGSAEVNISTTKGVIGATWVFRVLGGTVVSFVEELEVDITVMQFIKNHSGIDFEGEFFSPGIQGVIIQTVTVVEQNGLPDTPGAPILLGFGAGVGLGLLRAQVRKGVVNVGREIGLGSNVTVAAQDTAVVFRYTWGLRRPPSNSPLENVVSGVRGDPNRALRLFVGD